MDASEPLASSLPPALVSALADRYRVLRPLGEGGMATVYLAEDLRHGRQVALKLLKPELAAAIGPARFAAEIRVTATLQHPHLLPLFDSGEAAGQLFYVMPFVAGETLRARLTREGQLPIGEAVRLTRALAGALAYAHGAGIVHRDLKPENVLLQGGEPVIADFGIALAVANAGGERLTQTGLAVGTPRYMAPEQATGEKLIDARADLFALGAMLYEMLGGEAPYSGPTAQAILGRMLSEAPRSLRVVRPSIPPALEALTLRLLARLPADRFQRAEELVRALDALGDTFESSERPVAPTSARRRSMALLATIGVIGLAAGVGGSLVWNRSSASEVLVTTFGVTFPDLITGRTGAPWPGAISPDGRTIAVYAAAPGQPGELWVRQMDRMELRQIPNSQRAMQPVFSPDGEWLAFTDPTAESLLKVNLADGTRVRITDASSVNGVDWSPGNEIILGADRGFRGLLRVSANGGTLTEFTKTTTAEHIWPVVAPDSKHVAFVVYDSGLFNARLALTSLDDGRVSELGIRGIRPLGILDEQLVYVRADGMVMAVPIDLDARVARGAPVVVYGPVFVPSGYNGNSDVYLGKHGDLLELRGGSSSHIGWLDPAGRFQRLTKKAVDFGLDFGEPRLSPDERTAAMTIMDRGRSTVRLMDMTSGIETLISGQHSAWAPEWMPDGKSLIYLSIDSAGQSIVVQHPLDGRSPPRTIFSSPEFLPDRVEPSPDGRFLLAATQRRGSRDILAIPLDSAGGGAARPFLETSAHEAETAISRDGRWVAHMMGEGAKLGLWIRPYPGPGTGIRLWSGQSNRIPRWSRTGTVLHLTMGNGTVLRFHLDLSNAPQLVKIDSLKARESADDANGVVPTGFLMTDLARDGRMLGLMPANSGFQPIIVANWRAELRRKLAIGK